MKIVRNRQGWGKSGWGFGMHGPKALVPIAALGVACSSLLGIEDVSEGTGAAAGTSNAGNGGSTGGDGGKGGASGGTAGKGGAGGSGGGAGTGGKGGASGSGGSGGDSGEGGSGNEPSTGGTAGAGMGGSSGAGAGTAGTGGMPDPTVRGKVVNHWLQPIANVPVMIGDESVTTDEDGEFEIEDVDPTYTVSLVVTHPRYGATAQYGWIYEDLTRRDPTLQVYEGLYLADASYVYTPTNVPGNTGDIVVAALGGEYGNASFDGASARQSSFSWFGPTTVNMHAHGLILQKTDSLPTSYAGYVAPAAQIAFEEGVQTPWGLDFAGSATVASGNISGAVTSPTTNDRTNGVWVQFNTNASIRVVEHYGSSLTPDFTYLVPNIPTSSITVAAVEGTAFYGAAALAHRDGLAAGATSVGLTIPTPPTQVAPAPGATGTAETTFSWSGNQDTYVLRLVSENWYEAIYVVTTRKSVQWPTFPNGFSLRVGDDVGWRVETHGDYETVDDMTGDTGFMDEFGWSQGDYPEGPNRESGSYSISTGRLVTAP
jgi:hypothetical protein